MNLYLHQTHHQIADFKTIEEYLSSKIETEGLHVFCELFLTGYPLQDLCLQKSFVDQYHLMLERINQKLKSLSKNPKINLLIGGLEYELTDKGQPKIIRNVTYHLTPGQKMQAVYTKQLLPSYDIFDEAKYYHRGDSPRILEIEGKKIGLLICEDMWPSNIYEVDPAQQLMDHCQETNTKLDLLINLSASPFNLGKLNKRHHRASTLSEEFKCPFVYVNRVGGEDEILFDGCSFVINHDQVLAEAASFKSDIIEWELESSDVIHKIEAQKTGAVNTWEDLLRAALVQTDEGLRLEEIDEERGKELIEALIFGVQEYAGKCGFNKFLVALSGGMDSALVLTLLKLGLKQGQSIEAVYMPSQFSSTLSYDLSFELCQNLNIPLKNFPIKFLHSTMKNAYLDSFSQMLKGIADENVQSRLRGAIIYTHSNMSGAMVVNTSNKSELAVGYSTQYGDSVGAISMLGDVYKSEVFQISNLINKLHNNIIPEQIITRPPTAELREGQKDTDSLPPYPVLDAILEGILSYQMSQTDIINHGFSTEVTQKVFNLYRKTEYKRTQFCPIVKVKGKSFGFGYRIPTSKSSSFYLE